MTKGTNDICDDILELLTTTGKILLKYVHLINACTFKYILYLVIGLLTKQYILYY